jgi:hypothetical protein
LFTLNLFAQSECDIQKSYKAIFNIEKQQYGDRTFLMKSVNTLSDKSCFAELVNNYGPYLDYLRTNFTNNDNTEQLMLLTASIELKTAFVQSLKEDSLFNSVMETLTKKITDPAHFTPNTVSLDELLNVAVKFFSIYRITEEGYYAGKVCSGINGVKETEKVRKPQVEAFCFTTILKHHQGEQFNMYNEFVKGIKEL